MTTHDRLSQIITGAEVLRQVPAPMRVQAFQSLPETARLGIVRAAGAVPDACGGAMPMAPARGPLRVFEFLAPYPDGKEGTVLKPAGFQGRKTAQRMDVFGRMEAQSRRRGGEPVLTCSQIGMGRIYASMVQDRDASGVRCSSMEAMSGGGGTREGYTDHRLNLARQIDRLQARIGADCAMAIRRMRPSARGDGVQARRNILDRVLVDAVCLDDRDLSDVLRGHGWAVKGDTVRAATLALAAALDRMIGPSRSQRIEVVHFGAQPGGVWGVE
jgi:hypothetical protein